MGFLYGWTDTNVTNTLTRSFTVPTGKPVPAGSTIVIGLTFDSPSTTVGASDTRSNTWVVPTTSPQKSSTNVTGQIVYCKAATTIQVGDIITITSGVARFRTAVSIGVFDDVASVTQNATFGTGGALTGTSASATMGSATTSPNCLELLHVAGVSGINAVTAVTSGWTLIGSVKTAGGSAERVSALAYRYTTSTGTDTAAGTITSGEWTAEIMALPQVTGASVAAVAATATALAPVPTVSGGASPNGNVNAVVATATASAPVPTVSGNVGTRIAVFGDSLTYQNGNGTTYIQTALAAVGWNTDSAHMYIDGLNSREIWGAGATPLFDTAWDTMTATGFVPDVVIFALGTNNGGYSQADTISKAHSAMGKIGTGKQVHWIGVGYQTQADCDYTFTSGNSLGTRYTESGSRSRVNVVILNMLEATAFNSAVEAVPIFHDWNRSSKAVTARAGGSTNWDATDTSAPSGNARHMTNAGYQNYRDPYYAEAVGPPSEAALVTAVAATATATAPAPVLHSGSTVTSVAATGTAAAPAPVLNVGSSIAGVVSTSTATAPAPVLHAGSTVAAVVATSTAAAIAPTVAATQNPTVTAVVSTATALAPAPVLHAGSTVAAVVTTASSTAPAPTLSASVSVAAVTATATAAAPAPVLSAGQTVAAVVATGSALAPAPTVSATQSPTVLAVVATATASAPAPFVSAGGSVNVTAVAATATAQARPPVLSVGSTVTGVAATGTATALGPLVHASATVLARAATAQATALLPTIIGFDGDLVTPAERIYGITREDRTYAIATEPRTYPIPAEARRLEVPS